MKRTAVAVAVVAGALVAPTVIAGATSAGTHGSARVSAEAPWPPGSNPMCRGPFC